MLHVAMSTKCPYCKKNSRKGVCDHFVADLSDDGDGYDTEVPIYFGWENASNEHKQMYDSFYQWLLQVKQLLLIYADATIQARSEIESSCSTLHASEHLTMKICIYTLEYMERRKDFEVEDVIWGLDDSFQSAFEWFYLDANGGCHGEPL